MHRTAQVIRETAETAVTVAVNLDGQGLAEVDTGVGFLDHMLDQLARHGLLDLTVRAKGDLHVDFHHTVEDVGISVGQALAQALGERRGITRFGEATVPLDEALCRVVVDLSNRPHLTWRVSFPSSRVGGFDTELFHEWFAAFADHGRMTLHVECFYGGNSHHIIEACFKALARALRAALALDPRRDGVIPSTKGTLSA